MNAKTSRFSPDKIGPPPNFSQISPDVGPASKKISQKSKFIQKFRYTPFDVSAGQFFFIFGQDFDYDIAEHSGDQFKSGKAKGKEQAIELSGSK